MTQPAHNRAPGQWKGHRAFVVVIVIALCGVPTASGWAQGVPFGLGLAGNDASMARGVDASFANPANLALPAPHTGDHAQLRLLSIGAHIRSNSWGLGEYREFNGADLTAEDKATLLQRVPTDGFRLDGGVDVSALAYRRGGWAVFASSVGKVDGRLDRDVIDLLFNGNVEQLNWENMDGDGEAIASWQVGIAHGRELTRLAGGQLYGGLALARVYGLYYSGIRSAGFDLLTQTSGLSGEATAELLTSHGGSGWNLDAGLTWQSSSHLTVAAAWRRMVNTISWSERNERRVYQLAFQDLTVDNFDDSLWVRDESTERAGKFSRGLPSELQFSGAYDVGRHTLTGSATFGFANRLNVSTQPIVGVGVESRWIAFLPLRAGIHAGGGRHWAFGLGADLVFGDMLIKTGLMTDGALWATNADGVAGSIAIDFNL